MAVFETKALAVDRYVVKIENRTNCDLSIASYENQNFDWDAAPELKIKPGQSATAAGIRRGTPAVAGLTYRTSDALPWTLWFNFATNESYTRDDGQLWLRAYRTRLETSKGFSRVHFKTLETRYETWEVHRRSEFQREIAFGKMRIKD